jgi:nitrate reductase NapD
MADTDVVHISSLIVHLKPDYLTAVIESISEISGLEVQGHNESGKLVVTMETPTEHDVIDAIRVINDQPGVLNTSLIFHQIDDAGVEDISSATPANVGEQV